VVVSEELLILASCLLRPMSKNSVLEEFRVRRFAVTNRCSIATNGRIELVFGNGALSINVLHCVVRKFRYLQK